MKRDVLEMEYGIRIRSTRVDSGVDKARTPQVSVLPLGEVGFLDSFLRKISSTLRKHFL